MKEERDRLVALYGAAIVEEIESWVTPNPAGCKDSMDGRRWCRVHDASWPTRSGNRCTAVLFGQSEAEITTT
jgi:hypothetical protein